VPVKEDVSYYDQYDKIETVIGESNFMQSDNLSQVSGSLGSSDITEEEDHELDDYVRNTARNLAQFAIKSGMSKDKFLKLVKEGFE
jgi:hypothetical protein